MSQHDRQSNSFKALIAGLLILKLGKVEMSNIETVKKVMNTAMRVEANIVEVILVKVSAVQMY